MCGDVLAIKVCVLEAICDEVERVVPQESTLGRRCRNVIQMFCVCWERCTFRIGDGR